eukprot:gene278-363_t
MILSRSHIIQSSFVLAAALLIVKLFSIQVIHTEYQLAAEKNIVQRIEEVPYRGIIYDRNKQLLAYNHPTYDLTVIPKFIKQLDTLDFCQTFNLSNAAFEQMIYKAKRYSRTRPSIFLKDISHETLAPIHQKLSNYTGFYVKARTLRHYPQPILANTLGYVGEINGAQLFADTTQYYKQGDMIGISGLELQYEPTLRGQRGIQYTVTDARGQEKGRFKEGTLDVPAVPGQDLISTIDVVLQAYGEALMKNKIGSIVAIEPQTGEILAIVSSPSYDPNLLTPKNLSTHFSALAKDRLSPLFHRPIMAMYPPGSVFKIVQALIALQEGVITPYTQFICNKQIINCCHDHAPLTNLHQAIQYSCNPYFYHTFKAIINQHISSNTYEDTRIGLEKWLTYVYQFGLGKPLGIDLPHEKGGYLPTPAFYNARYGKGRWKASTIRSLCIGQGEILATPLQMANLAALIANRGCYFTPHLIKAIGDHATAIKKHILPIEPQHFDLVIKAMHDVITSSSGRRAYLPNVPICGKTSTVENPHGADHSAFMGFAPLKDPKIAIAVYVENSGWGSRAATTIAGLMLEKYLTGTVTRQPYDGVLLVLYTLLVLFGWINLYAIDYEQGLSTSILFNLATSTGKQFLWIASSSFLLVTILFSETKLYRSLAYVLYALSILLLAATLLWGVQVGGHSAWLQWQGIKLQPTEFVKLTCALAIAKRLDNINAKLTQRKTQVGVLALILIPIALILLQGDVGSALVFSIFFLVLYREGFPVITLLTGLSVVALFILKLLFPSKYIIISALGIGLLLIGAEKKTFRRIFTISTIVCAIIALTESFDWIESHLLKPHHQQRLKVLVDPTTDPRGIGWNVIQSKISIGAGGILGRGFLKGTQTKYGFVPEQRTDFIFCTIGEEYGWVGSTLFIATFMALLLRILYLAERQRIRFARVYGYGIASVLFCHFFINVGMTIGLVPVIGIPLPFISYGGSSLWAFSSMLFILLKFDSERNKYVSWKTMAIDLD